ncbi:unnamed protein product [Symbiodinium sp. CCMP2592]|nr:unnamed protein product [Symbiodinium sp. CCMP2592]
MAMAPAWMEANSDSNALMLTASFLVVVVSFAWFYQQRASHRVDAMLTLVKSDVTAMLQLHGRDLQQRLETHSTQVCQLLEDLKQSSTTQPVPDTPSDLKDFVTGDFKTFTDDIKQEFMQVASRMTELERLLQQLPVQVNSSIEDSRAKSHKMTKSSVQEIFDLGQGSLQTWMTSELQARLDSIITVLTGVQAELTLVSDSTRLDMLENDLKEAVKMVDEHLNNFKDFRINESSQHQAVVSLAKQTQSMMSSMRSDILQPLQYLHNNAATHGQVRGIEQNLDLANQNVWSNQGHLKGQDDSLAELSNMVEKIQQVLLKVQTQMEKIISRLTPPQQKAPPPTPPSQPAQDLPAQDPSPVPKSSASTSSTPSPISPLQGGAQPDVPILRIQESLPLRQPVSLFANLPHGPPMHLSSTLHHDPRAREALAYLAQICGMMP